MEITRAEWVRLAAAPPSRGLRPRNGPELARGVEDTLKAKPMSICPWRQCDGDGCSRALVPSVVVTASLGAVDRDLCAIQVNGRDYCEGCAPMARAALTFSR